MNVEYSDRGSNVIRIGCLMCFNIWRYSMSNFFILWIFLESIEYIFKCIKLCEYDLVAIF